MERYLGEQTDFVGEVWKQIDDTNYYISNKGRLRSDKYLIKLQKNKKTSLMQGMIYCNGKPKLLNIQGWVGKYFLPEPPNGDMIIRHKTNNLCDNRVENLVWGFAGNHKNIENNIMVCGKKKAKKPHYKYIIKQYTLSGLCFATFIGFDELLSMGFKRHGIIAQSNGSYYKDNYKGYRFKVTKIKED